MKRSELVKKVSEVLEVTQVRAKEIIESIESVITEEVKSSTEASVDFANATFSQKFVKARSGEMKREDGTTIPWSTEDHYEGSVKAKTALKELK